jgi:hypothetical protein
MDYRDVCLRFDGPELLAAVRASLTTQGVPASDVYTRPVVYCDSRSQSHWLQRRSTAMVSRLPPEQQDRLLQLVVGDAPVVAGVDGAWGVAADGLECSSPGRLPRRARWRRSCGRPWCPSTPPRRGQGGRAGTRWGRRGPSPGGGLTRSGTPVRVGRGRRPGARPGAGSGESAPAEAFAAGPCQDGDAVGLPVDLLQPPPSASRRRMPVHTNVFRQTSSCAVSTASSSRRSSWLL